MTAQAIREIVEKQAAGHWDEPHAHGVNLRRCLVDPKLVPLREPLPNHSWGALEAWLVLIQDPKTNRGYRIVADLDGSRFGLATDAKDKGEMIFLGWHGNLITTLEAM